MCISDCMYHYTNVCIGDCMYHYTNGLLNFSLPSVAPTIYQQPQDQVAVKNYTATFTCSTNGLPRPDITWMRVVNGLSLIITATSKYSIATTPIGVQNQTSTLIVSNASFDDATSYICQANNTVGSTDASATLTVQGIFYITCKVHCTAVGFLLFS